jgi:hypothetical protein
VSSPSTENDLLLVVDEQAGVVARRQLKKVGVRREVVRSHLRAKRWRRVLPGTYATFTGSLPPMARVWAAILYASPHAVASHETAAWLHQLRPDLPACVDVVIPHGQRYRRSRTTVRVRQSRHVAARTQPARSPARTTIEDTILDLTDASRSELPVIDLILRACQQRKTSPARLALRMRARRRLRWRQLLKDLISEVRIGVLSALERRYFGDVERAHGLPRGTRNKGEGPSASRRYRDVGYRAWRLIVELDGQATHPADQRERDDLRDNEVAERQERTLRYGWRSVTTRPCRTAGQVARLLRQGGWTGSPVRCGPDCGIDADLLGLDD